MEDDARLGLRWAPNGRAAHQLPSLRGRFACAHSTLRGRPVSFPLYISAASSSPAVRTRVPDGQHTKEQQAARRTASGWDRGGSSRWRRSCRERRACRTSLRCPCACTVQTAPASGLRLCQQSATTSARQREGPRDWHRQWPWHAPREAPRGCRCQRQRAFCWRHAQRHRSSLWRQPGHYCRRRYYCQCPFCWCRCRFAGAQACAA